MKISSMVVVTLAIALFSGSAAAQPYDEVAECLTRMANSQFGSTATITCAVTGCETVVADCRRLYIDVDFCNSADHPEIQRRILALMDEIEALHARFKADPLSYGYDEGLELVARTNAFIDEIEWRERTVVKRYVHCR